MDQNTSSFTVLFQPPFWVGVAERWDEAGYQAARVVFGAQPSDAQVWQWVLHSWHRLRFGAPEEGAPPPAPKNPKRALRLARQAVQESGAGTRSQQALARQREEDGARRRRDSREQLQAEEERKFLLRQQKKREKRRGR